MASVVNPASAQKQPASKGHIPLSRRVSPGYVLIFPAVLLIGTMMVYPVFQTLYFSMSRVQLPMFRTTFVGLDNFFKIFADPETPQLFSRTMVWIVGTVILRLALGLGAALVFNAKVRGTVWMRIVAVLPWTIPSDRKSVV